MTPADLIAELAAHLPAPAHALRTALRDFVAAPSREGWRTCCALTCAVCGQLGPAPAYEHVLTDDESCDLIAAMQQFCLLLGWPELEALLAPSIEELRRSWEEVPGLGPWRCPC